MGRMNCMSTTGRHGVACRRVANPTRALHLEVPDDGPLCVLADADRIGQMVANYATSALKYSDEDRPVSVRVTTNGDWARVSSRGVGAADAGCPERI
jgi:signal transduction histidine kinase